MGEPTIYRRPTAVLPAHPPKKRDLEKWKKHRESKELPATKPVVHKN